MTQLLPPKKEVALALLERSNVDVYLDPRAKGVVVPPQFRKEPRLILKIGLNMPVPIPDLRLDEESMCCTLSFSRSPFYCIVPWTSVFAMVGEDGRGMVWPDDVPQELANKVAPPPNGGAPTSVASPSPSSSGRRGARASKLADDSRQLETRDARDVPVERPSRATATRGGKKKKKDEPARPMLVAVPSGPSASSGSSDAHDIQDAREARAAADRRDSAMPSAGSNGARAAGPSRPAAPHASSSSPPSPHRRPDGQARPKRELPPYLRVVK